MGCEAYLSLVVSKANSCVVLDDPSHRYQVPLESDSASLETRSRLLLATIPSQVPSWDIV